MKNVFLLSLTVGLLAGCAATAPAPVVNADDADLAPGEMQPIFNTGAVADSYGWQTEIQQVAMPESMSIPEEAWQNVPQRGIEVPAEARYFVSSPHSQNVNIPRDENNKPIYSQIQKGGFQGDFYVVQKGDTPYLIAYLAGKDIKEIEALNHLTGNYQLLVGQKLRLRASTPGKHRTTVSPPSSASQKPFSTTSKPHKTTSPHVPSHKTITAKPATVKASVAPASESTVTYTAMPNGTAYGSDGTVTGPIKASVGRSAPVTASVGTVKQTVNAQATPMPSNAQLNWQWPTNGRVVSKFSAGNKGIDIAGNKGQAVRAAAAGEVVYPDDSGNSNAYRGYGNLILINHNEEYLSVYAHNDKIKVKLGQKVKAGQDIATMGSTGTHSNKLYFEIRRKGEAVDPIRYLPKR